MITAVSVAIRHCPPGQSDCQFLGNQRFGPSLVNRLAVGPILFDRAAGKTVGNPSGRHRQIIVANLVISNRAGILIQRPIMNRAADFWRRRHINTAHRSRPIAAVRSTAPSNSRVGINQNIKLRRSAGGNQPRLPIRAGGLILQFIGIIPDRIANPAFVLRRLRRGKPTDGQTNVAILRGQTIYLANWLDWRS